MLVERTQKMSRELQEQIANNTRLLAENQAKVGLLHTALCSLCWILGSLAHSVLPASDRCASLLHAPGFLTCSRPYLVDWCTLTSEMME